MASKEKHRGNSPLVDNEAAQLGEAPTVRALEDEPNTVTAEGAKRPNPFGALDVTAAPKMPALEPGVVVKHYEFIRQLGTGGMGTVFLARDTRLGRLVAVKLLLKYTGPTAYRFLREARTTAQDGRTDIWAVGVILYEMLAGQRPLKLNSFTQGANVMRANEDLQGYAAAMMWHKAIEAALDMGHESPTGTDLKDALETFNWVDLEGMTAQPISFTKGDHRPQSQEYIYHLNSTGVLVLADKPPPLALQSKWLGY